MSDTDRTVSREHLVGGVMSGWNSYQETGATIVRRARGPRLWDTAGREFIDWNMGWGSLVLGHSPDAIRSAITEALDEGFGFPYETEASAELGSLVCAVTATDRVRFANSGLEATHHAIRLARRETGRWIVVKFEGHFHGLHDGLLYGVDAGRPVGPIRTDGSIAPVPGSAGMPDHVLGGLIRVIPFNDLEALHKVFEAHRDQIACVIMEPIALNMGCIRPDPGFLESVRETCDTNGSLLIYDEVRTGFRVAPGGAAQLLGVSPDLVCYGKALGCGMPIAAVAGRRAVMDHLSPVGDVEMAGTNTGRNMLIRASLAALREVARPGFHDRLDRLQSRFIDGCTSVFRRHRVPAYVEGCGGTIGIYLGLTERPRNFRDVLAHWNRAYQVACYREAYANHGLYGFLLPQGDCPEAVVLSSEHTPAVIDSTLEKLDRILKAVPYFEKS